MQIRSYKFSFRFTYRTVELSHVNFQSIAFKKEKKKGERGRGRREGNSGRGEGRRMNQARHFQQTSIHPTFTLVSGGERAIKGKTGDTGHHGDTMRGANNLGLAVQSNNYTGICVWIAWWRSWSSLNRRCPLIVSSISRFPSHCETCRSDDVVRDMLKFSSLLPLLSTIIQLLYQIPSTEITFPLLNSK